MRTVFADTFFFIALLDARERTHTRASDALRDPELRVVTTEWVLAEFGNAYADPRDRADFRFIREVGALISMPSVSHHQVSQGGNP